MAHAEYFNAQTKLQDILANCQDWNGEQLKEALNGLLVSTVEMVRVKKQTVSPITPPTPIISSTSYSTRPVARLVVLPTAGSDSSVSSDISDNTRPVARLVVLPTAAASAGSSTPRGPPPPQAFTQNMVMANQTGELRPRTAVVYRMSWTRYSTNFMKKRAIGAAKFNTRCAKACSICWDTHTYGESVITDCNHCFGKECWQTWMTQPNGNQSCPECRTHTPKTVFYSQMAERKTKQAKEEEALARAEARSAGFD